MAYSGISMSLQNDVTLTSAERFRLLNTVDESFQAMLEAVQNAKKSVRLEMYIFTVSPIGETFRTALVEAAQRGVDVKLLLDAWGSMNLPEKFWGTLVEAGGQVRWFNPIHLKCCGFRNHRKLLLCDEEMAFVGGFNISTEYQGDGVSKGWRDLGLQFSAPMARHLADSFDALFGMADFRHKTFARLRKPPLRNIIHSDGGQILLGGPGRGRNFFKTSLIRDLAKADTARIICAYFLPTLPVRRALTRLAKAGGRVQLILAGRSDVPIMRLASHRFYGTFLKAGVEIYEYQPQILHAKLFVLDDIVYIGSANLDRRSFHINYELVLRLPNADLARQAEAVFESDLRFSQRIDAVKWRHSRTFWNKFKEYCAHFILARIDPYIARRQLRTLR